MKKLNIPLVLGLVIGGAVALVGIHFLHGYQVNKNAEFLLARAESASVAGDHEEQVRLLMRYVRHRKDDVATLKKLLVAMREQLEATVNTDNVDVRQAQMLAGSVEKAVRDYPDDVELRREAYKVEMLFGHITDALSNLAEIENLNGLTNEDRIAFAKCKYLTGDRDDALQDLAKMVGFDISTSTFDETKAVTPNEVDAYTFFGSLYSMEKSRTNDDVTITQLVADQCVKVNPENPLAYLARAQFLTAKVKTDEGQAQADADVHKAVSLAPDEVRTILSAASHAMQSRDYVWANELLTNGMAKHPTEVAMFDLRAELARVQDKPEEALQWIVDGLKNSPLNGPLLARRADFEIDLKRIDDAKQTLLRLEEKRYDPLRMELLRARVDMSEGQGLSAIRRLEKLRPLARAGSNTEIRAKEYLIALYRQNGMLDKLPGLVEVNEKDPQSMFNQADLYASQGRLDDAIELYKKLLTDHEKDLSPEGRDRIIRNLLAAAINKERRRPAAERDWQFVDRLAEMMLKRLNMRDFEREQFAIDILMQKELTSEALRKSERCMQTYPTVMAFPLKVAELTPDAEQAKRVLDQVELKFGDTVALRLTRANRILAERPENAVEQLAALKEGATKLSEEERLQLTQIIANGMLRLGAFAESIAATKTLIEARPDILAFRLTVFDLAMRSDNSEEASAQLKEIERIAGRTSAEWLTSEARRQLWLIKKGERTGDDMSDILALVDKAFKERPDYAAVFQLRGEIALRQGNVPSGIEALETAVQKQPGHIPTLQLLIDAYTAVGRRGDADRLRQQMPSDSRRTTDVVREIELMLASDPAKALEMATKAFPPNSDNVAGLSILAQVYQAAGKPAESLPILQRMIDLAPASGANWRAMVTLLVKLERKDEALGLIEKAKTQIAESERPLTIAQCYALAGDYEQAEAAYLAALKQAPNDLVVMRNLAGVYQFSEKSDQFNALLERMATVPPTDEPGKQLVAWARRVRAGSMSASGVFQDFKNAVALVDQNKDANGDLAPADLDVWLRLHAARPDAESRGRARKKLSEIQEQRELSDGESIVLAQLYEAEGRWTEAQSLMISMLAKHPENGELVDLYIQWLLKRKDFSEAATWIGRLNQDAMGTIRYRCILMTQRGNSKDAHSTIMSLVPKRLTAIQAAQLMNQLGAYDAKFYKAAQQVWKKHLETKPTDVTGYIDFLRQLPEGRGLEEAFALVEKPYSVAVSEKNGQAVQYYLGILLKSLRENKRSVPANSPLYGKFENMLAAAPASGVDPMLLNWLNIDYYDIRTEYAKLETLYIDILKNPNLSKMEQAMLRNNLAFVYAVSNQGPKALETIGDAIDQLGPRSDFLDTRGLAYYASGKYDEAIEDLTKAVAGSDATAATNFHLAMALHKGEKKEEAAVAFQKAIDMGLSDADLSPPEIKLFERLKKEFAATVPDGAGA